MPIRPRQFESILKRGLKPVYLLSGDEPLQINEAMDVVRQAAREQGFSERTILTVEPGFEWSRLLDEASSLSLFAQRRILDLRLGKYKPGKVGEAALMAYLAKPFGDVLLLIQSARLDRAAAGKAWVKQIERMGIWMAAWSLRPDEMRRWLRERLHQRGLRPDESALDLLQAQVEGNLLAAAQEIELLTLVHGSGPLDAATILAVVSGNARYDAGELIEATLGGDRARMERILRGLRAEGVEPTLLAWLLIHAAGILVTLLDGESMPDRARRLSPVQRKLLEHAASHWAGVDSTTLITLAARLDRLVKGRAVGDVWNELLQFGMVLSGRTLWPSFWSLQIEDLGVLS